MSDKSVFHMVKRKQAKREANPLVVLFRYYWRFSREDRPRVWLYLFMFLIANLLDFLPPLVIAKILNIVQEQGVTSANYLGILGWLAVIVLIEVGFWLFHGPARVMEQAVAFRIDARYKKFLLDGTLHLPATWHSNNHSGDTIDKIEKATTALRDFSSRIFENVQLVVRFIGSYIALVYFNLSASYIIILFCVASIYIITRMDRRIIPRFKRLNTYQNRIAARVFDTISNISTVLILRIERPMLRMIGRKIDEPFDYDRKTRKINELKWFITAMMFTTMIFFVIGTYVFHAVSTGATVMVGTLSVLFNYTNRIGGLFFRFTYRYGDFVRWRTNIANAEEISDEFSHVKRRRKSVLGTGWKRIHIRDLEFQYEDEKSKNLHLDKVSFTLGRGERVAFIGASGSGKTTALKVIRELYPSRNVDLFVDEKRIEGGFSKISREIALIPQDPEIFSTTIKENISLGLPVSNKKIERYAKLAKFSDVIKRLPNGLRSSINERGVNLSGGEKQRLALARGLLACEDKQIVLLDEPTSSVDPKNELEIYENVFSLFRDKTIVSSIHRLHLLPLFDRIYLFDRGRIVGSGDFETLQRESALFSKMLEKYERSRSRRKR